VAWQAIAVGSFAAFDCHGRVGQNQVGLPAKSADVVTLKLVGLKLPLVKRDGESNSNRLRLMGRLAEQQLIRGVSTRRRDRLFDAPTKGANFAAFHQFYLDIQLVALQPKLRRWVLPPTTRGCEAKGYVAPALELWHAGLAGSFGRVDRDSLGRPETADRFTHRPRNAEYSAETERDRAVRRASNLAVGDQFSTDETYVNTFVRNDLQMF
jgi:hypothetical protein